MKKLNTITSKEDVKLFSELIKNEIKKYIVNVEQNLSGGYGIGLINDDDNTHYCHICEMEIPRLFKANEDAIGVYDFMWRNGFNLNKDTTDLQLMKVVDKIIDEYNRKVPENNEAYEIKLDVERLQMELGINN